jgi:hypothetical protein
MLIVDGIGRPTEYRYERHGGELLSYALHLFWSVWGYSGLLCFWFLPRLLVLCVYDATLLYITLGKPLSPQGHIGRIVQSDAPVEKGYYGRW